MGTWGHAYDANDEAAEFLDDVTTDGEWDVVAQRIVGYVEKGGYEDARETVAALELTAAALGRPHAGMEPDHAAWASRYREEASSLREAALRAVDLVKDKSELSELWAESVVDLRHRDGWRREIDDLKIRLSS